MARWWKLAVAAAFGGAYAHSSSISSLEKVVKMLEDLKTEVTEEGTAEEANYQKFAEFCSTTQKKKTDAVKLGEDKAEEHTAGITQKTSSYEETLAEIEERKTKGETLSSEKEASTAQCKDDQESFESSEADLASAVVGLESAISKVTATKGALMQLDHLQKSLDLAEALGFVQTQKKAQTLALLQEPWLEEAGAEYNKKDYAFQSAGVVSTLQDLLKQFRDERSKGQEEWKKTKQACSEFETSRSKAISENTEAITAAETTAATLKGELADVKQLLLQTKNTLRDDSSYLAELKANCDARDSDFKQRSQMREDETKAIAQAIKVMKEKAMTSAEAASFLQLTGKATSNVEAKQATALRGTVDAASATTAGALAAAAAQTLKQKAAELHSQRLSGLALQMQREPSVAVNPLQAVKDMVQGLVNQLLEEAAKQATQKGFCESAMGKATKERDRRLREAKKLSATLGSLDSKRSELLEENELLKDEIAKLEKDLLAATDLRTDESKENLKEIKEAKQGFEATKEAIATLVEFYKSAERKATNHDKNAAVLVQTAEDPEAGFEGSYGGKQKQANGVISMLEVVRDDFEKSATSTEESEDKAADEFTKLKLQSKTDISGKTTQKKLNEEELESAVNDLTSDKVQLQTTMDLLDGALRTLEDLKPQCVDSTMSYEERKAKREEELEALKTAMCTLDKEGVEPMCKK